MVYGFLDLGKGHTGDGVVDVAVGVGKVESCYDGGAEVIVLGEEGRGIGGPGVEEGIGIEMCGSGCLGWWTFCCWHFMHARDPCLVEVLSSVLLEDTVLEELRHRREWSPLARRFLHGGHELADGLQTPLKVKLIEALGGIIGRFNA